MSGASGAGRLLVVGDPFFLERHKPLVDALRAHFDAVDELPVVDPGRLARLRFGLAAVARGEVRPPLRPALRRLRDRFEKRPATFARKSRETARRIAALRPAPDVVLHLFGMSSPVAPGTRPAVPYAHYADATMAFTARAWPAWVPYRDPAELAAWQALERETYGGAVRALGFTSAAADSYVADYGVAPERAVAVGAAGKYERVGGPRAYGTRRAIFNGSDFGRKGGDLALEAFATARERVPDAALTIVGNDPLPELVAAGVETLGPVPHAELVALFDRADVVLAPARADTIPGFTLEAMSRGCAPLVSDRPGVADVVRDGIDGFVRPLDVAALADALVRLLVEPGLARRLGDAARERVEREWNWTAVAARIAAELHAATPPGPAQS